MKKLSILFLCSVCVLAFTACGDSAESSYNKGEEALQDEDYETAIENFTTAIEADPNAIEAYLGRAKAYLEQGETEESLASAKSDYEKVLELDEGNVDGTLGMADIYIREGDTDAARDLLEEALENTDGNEEIVDKLAEFDSGEIYDSSEHLRYRFDYDVSGKLLWYQTLTYNEDGKESSVTSFDLDGNQTGHVDLEYDEDGRSIITYNYKHPVEEVDETTLRSKDSIYSQIGVVFKIEHEYDDKGNLTKETECNPDGSLNKIFTTEYNEAGKPTKTQLYSSDRGLEQSSIYEYDEEGNLIGNYSYDEDGNITSGITYEYEDDEEANTRKSISRGLDGNETIIETEYDDNGRIIKESYYFNDVLDFYKVYTYDENGDRIRTDVYDKSGELTNSIIEY